MAVLVLMLLVLPSEYEPFGMAGGYGGSGICSDDVPSGQVVFEFDD